MNELLTPDEIGLIRYYRSLTDERIREAIYLWLLSGDMELVTRHLRQAA